MLEKLKNAGKNFGSVAGSTFVALSPGMRMIKTAIAVFISLIITYIIPQADPLQTAISAVVCIQPTRDFTWRVSLGRIVGTLLSGLYSFLMMYLNLNYFHIDASSIGFYLYIALTVLPLMQLLVLVRLPEGVAIATIVYVIVAFGDTGELSVTVYIARRVFSVLIGVIVAVVLDNIPALNKLGEKMLVVKLEAQEDSSKLWADILHLRSADDGEEEEETEKAETSEEGTEE